MVEGQKTKSAVKKTKTGALRVVIPVLTLIITGLSLFVFVTRSYKDARNDAYEAMESEAAIIRIALNENVNGMYDSLETLSTTLSSANQTDINAVVSTMKKVADNGMFVDIAYVTADRTAYLSDGNVYTMQNYSFLQRAFAGEKNIEHVKEDGYNGEYFVVSVPVFTNTEVSGVYCGIVPREMYDKLLVPHIFSDKSNYCITDSNGNVIAASAGSGRVVQGDNLFSFYETVKFDDSSSLASLKDNVVNRRSGTMMYSTNSETRCCTYSYLEVNDWYIFSSVLQEEIYAQIKVQMRRTIGLCFQIVLCVILVGVYYVISERRISAKLKQEKDKLYESEQRYRLVEEFSGSVIFDADLKNDVFTFNVGFAENYRKNPFVSKVSDLLKVNPYVAKEDMHEYLRMGREINEGSERTQAKYRIVKEDGSMSWCRVETKCVYDIQGTPVHIIGRITNIDKEQRDMLLLEAKANTDPLTRLFNREAAKARIDAFLMEEGRSGLHAFMIVDIDNFKAVNDTFGHTVGDEVLKSASYEMMGLFRSGDVIGRLGGDEFLIFMKDVHTINVAKNKARSLNLAVENIGRYKTEGEALSCSIGIAFSPNDGVNFDELYAKADNAMYRAKRAGKAACELFDRAENYGGKE